MSQSLMHPRLLGQKKEALLAQVEEKFKGDAYAQAIEAVEIYLARYKGDKKARLDDAYFLKGESYRGLAGNGKTKKAKEDALKKLSWPTKTC